MKIAKFLVTFTLCFLCVSPSFSSRIAFYNLAQLSAYSHLIVVGDIDNISDQRITVEVKRYLRGDGDSVISVGYKLPPLYIMDTSSLIGKDKILFIQESNGVISLLGEGFGSIWKCNECSYMYRKVYSDATLEETMETIESILKIEGEIDFNRKVSLCAEYLNSKNELLQSTTLDYLHSDLLWVTGPGIKRKTSFSREESALRRKIYESLIPYVQPLLESDIDEVRSQAFQMLVYAPIDIAIPALINGIQDESLGVRNVTADLLYKFSYNLGMKDLRSFEYNPKGDTKYCEGKMQEMNSWWNENKEQIMNLYKKGPKSTN